MYTYISNAAAKQLQNEKFQETQCKRTMSTSAHLSCLLNTIYYLLTKPAWFHGFPLKNS